MREDVFFTLKLQKVRTSAEYGLPLVGVFLPTLRTAKVHFNEFACFSAFTGMPSFKLKKKKKKVFSVGSI